MHLKNDSVGNLILKAYVNELILDKHISRTTVFESRIDWFFKKRFFFRNYKVSTLPSVPKIIFVVAAMIFSNLVVVTVHLYVRMFILFLRRGFQRNIPFKNTYLLELGAASLSRITDLGVTESNIELIPRKRITDLSFRVTPSVLFSGLKECSLVLSRISKIKNRKMRRSLFLNCFDILDLWSLATFFSLNADKKTSIYCDSHYQRWTFLLSHLVRSGNFNVVQHGYIDDDIRFKFPFGRIDNLYILDEHFLSAFRKYFKILNFDIYHRELLFTPPPPGLVEGKILLFISSPMFEIEEKRFLNSIIKNGEFENFFLKPHPRFKMSEDMIKFCSDNGIVISEPLINADCYIAYKSFLIYELRAYGIKEAHELAVSDYAGKCNANN
jgi:hypothetical protein